MPVIAFALLCPDGKLNAAGHRVRSLLPGVVLTTGQSVSGKVTMLIALAAVTAGDGGPVALMSDQPEEFAPFRPLPDGWREVCVPGNAEAWQAALRAEAASGALPVIAPLNRANAPAAFEAARTRPVFAAADTLLAGLDTSYMLRDLGVPYDTFADTVRCVWSQFLVEALCPHCAAEAVLAPDEAERLFPAGPPPRPIRTEVGCGACGGRGTHGRVAISDVTFIADHARPAVRTALADGVTLSLGADAHIAARDQACELLAGGAIGIDTYRDATQRNPLLRMQSALESVRAQSAKLAGMFDTFVRSLWLDVRVLEAVAERTAAGVIVAEEDRRIRFASARARRALAAGSELSIVDDHLQARSPRLRRALAAALARAAGRAAAATRIAVGGENGAHRNVFVAPLPTARGFASGMRRLVLVVVDSRGDSGLLPSEHDLRGYFDLTPAESRVALLLCAGHAPKDVGRRLDVSIHTVRSHLRALLGKTGTSRQSELVRLLSSLPRTGSDTSTAEVGGARV